MKYKPVEEVVPSGVVVGGYRIERKLGAGGQGKVYLAWREGRAYALKFIHLERVGEWGWRELFILLSHSFANVVKLVSHLKWPEDKPEFLVLVMEYVEGRPLHRWAEEDNPCARAVARVMLKLARALEAIHARHVLHRDLKEDNVLVRTADGEPVLVDFGAGTMQGAPRITRGALAPGDLHHRSPESVAFFLRESRQPDERYDYSPADEMYALGVSLYALLTDTYPIDDAEPLMLGQILTYQPAAPHELNERVPRALSELCMRLLEKEPRRRLASAGALCEALEAVLKEAQGDAAWDVPLFPGWGETDSGELEAAGGGQPDWVQRWVREKPRRGKRPAPARPAAPEPPPPGPALPTPTTAPLAWPAAVLRHADVLAALLKAAVVLGVLVLAGLGAEQLLHRWEPSRPMPPSTRGPVPMEPPWAGLAWMEGDGGEVAPPARPPEAAGATAPPPADPTPVAAASRVTPPKDTSPVKTQQQKKKDSRPKQEHKGLDSLVRNACAGLTGMALQACLATPQQVPPVRQNPPPQACPPGAVETMEKRLYLRPGYDSGAVELPGWDPRKDGGLVPVREGPVSFRLFRAACRDTPNCAQVVLPRGTLLFGRLYIGDKRVIGRFTQARTPSGETFSVCMEAEGTDGRPGMDIMPDEGAIKVPGVADLTVVERFE